MLFKKFVLFFLIIFCLFLAVAPVSAGTFKQYGLQGTGGQAKYDITGEKANITGVVNAVVKVALSFLAFIFFGMMLYAGIRWMTAYGVEEHATKARDTLIAASIGLIIVVASYAIANFVLGRLAAGGGGETVQESGHICVSVNCASLNEQQNCERTRGRCRWEEECGADLIEDKDICRLLNTREACTADDNALRCRWAEGCFDADLGTDICHGLPSSGCVLLGPLCELRGR